MAFSYDLSTDIGYLRLLITDGEASNYIFEDEELQAFLTRVGNNVYRAGILAYGTIIRSRALLAKKISREGYSSEEYAISELKAAIEDLKDQSISVDGLSVGEFALSDDHFESYRPGWEDVNADPVVE